MHGYWLALAAALWFSLGSLCVRNGNEHLDRDTGLAVCLLVNASVLLVATSARILAVGMEPVQWVAVGFFAAAGFSSSFLARWATIGSIHRLGPSRAAVMKNSQPVLTAVLAVAILGERMTVASALAALLIVVGAGACSAERTGGSGTMARWGVLPEHKFPGVLLAFLSATGYAVANILRKAGLETWDEPLMGAMIGVLTATLSSLALRQRSGQATQPGGGDRRLGYLYFGLYGLLAATAQMCIFFALRTTEAWITNLFVGTEPAVTAALSWLLYRGREHFSPLAVGSIGAVVVGSALMFLV